MSVTVVTDLFEKKAYDSLHVLWSPNLVADECSLHVLWSPNLVVDECSYLLLPDFKRRAVASCCVKSPAAGVLCEV